MGRHRCHVREEILTWIQLTWYSWYNRCNWSLMRSLSKASCDLFWFVRDPRQNACDVTSRMVMAWSWKSWGSEDQDVQRRPVCFWFHWRQTRRWEDELRSLVAKEPDTKSGTLNLLKESEMGTLLLNMFCTVLLLDYCDLQQFSYAFCPSTGWTVENKRFCQEWYFNPLKWTSTFAPRWVMMSFKGIAVHKCIMYNF